MHGGRGSDIFMTETAKKSSFAGQVINQRPPCHVCTSPHKQKIEEEIRRGTRYWEISMLYGVSERSIFKHKKNHMKKMEGADE